MKNIFKKNQIIITALVIMIIIAGYLNFSGRMDNDKTADVGTGEVLDYDTYTETSGDNILDGSTVTLDEDPDAIDIGLLNELGLDPTTKSDTGEDGAVAEGTKDGANQTADIPEDNVDTADISDEDAATEEVAQFEVTDTGEVLIDEKTSTEGEKTSTPGEAILVSTTIAPNYFANAKLEREQKRSISRETLMELVNNTNLTDEAKEDATKSIIKLTAKAEKENATETLLEAKGFSDAVVIMSDEGIVDVIINAVSVTEQDIAQVEDIVKRQTGAESSEIVISPVVAEE